MRRKHLELYGAALLLAVMLLAGAPNWARANTEEDFDDDDAGVEINSIEDLQDEFSTTGSSEETVEPVEELPYESPKFDPQKFYFVDHFDNIDESTKRWIKSQAKKDDTAEEIAKYDGIWKWEAPQRIVWKNDIGLVLKSKAKHAAIASLLSKPFTFKDEKPLVVQYEVTMQEGQECGGSYIKLLSAGKNTDDLTKFNDKTPYTIMFGPDKCGNDFKLHFIFRHVNPINGSISEKHCRRPKERLEEPFKDKLPHLYTLIVRPDNTFEIRVDHKIINQGSLLNDFTPAVNPPLEIDDPEDKKPTDWDEREKIPDPTAHKPEDWDDDAPPQIPDVTAIKPDDWLDEEPEMIPDPEAVKPEDWDTEIDGEWEPPLVDNPVCEKVAGCGQWKAPLITNKEYKGKWRAPLIDNPNYQGKWSARKIPNPDYFEDLSPFKMTPISAIGIELWSMSNDILFDNLIITDDLAVADEFASKSFDIKRKYIDKESETFMSKISAFFTENPMGWKVGVVLICVPLAFLLYRATSSGGKKEPVEDAADAKKTDALQDDDDVSASGGDAKCSSKKKSSSPKKKKSDLDVKDASAGSDDSAGAAADTSEEKEDSNEAVDEKTEETEESTERTGARKRRIRADRS